MQAVLLLGWLNNPKIVREVPKKMHTQYLITLHGSFFSPRSHLLGDNLTQGFTGSPKLLC